MAAREREKEARLGLSSFSLSVHDLNFSPTELLINPDSFPHIAPGDFVQLASATVAEAAVGTGLSGGVGTSGTKRLVLQVDAASVEPVKGGRMQISLLKSLADSFGLQPWTDVAVTKLDPATAAVDFVEFTIRDQFIARADMWRFKMSVFGRSAYIGKHFSWRGMRARVRELNCRGSAVESGILTESTNFIFRSQTSRFVWLVQISTEMYDHAPNGQLHCEIFVDFVRQLLGKWSELQAKHSLTVVFFCRTFFLRRMDSVQLRKGLDYRPIQFTADGQAYEDTYKVVVENEQVHNPTDITLLLKRELLEFPRLMGWCGVLNPLQPRSAGGLPQPQAHLDGEVVTVGVPSYAGQGNFLEALNVTLNVLEKHYMDRDLTRSGNSIVSFSASSGMFQVDQRLAGITKQRMMDNGIGMDMVSLSQPPLHVVPLFMYTSTEPAHLRYEVPHWMNLSFATSPDNVVGGSLVGAETLMDSDRPAHVPPRQEAEEARLPIPRLTISPLFEPEEDGRVDVLSHLPTPLALLLNASGTVSPGPMIEAPNPVSSPLPYMMDGGWGLEQSLKSVLHVWGAVEPKRQHALEQPPSGKSVSRSPSMSTSMSISPSVMLVLDSERRLSEGSPGMVVFRPTGTSPHNANSGSSPHASSCGSMGSSCMGSFLGKGGSMDLGSGMKRPFPDQDDSIGPQQQQPTLVLSHAVELLSMEDREDREECILETPAAAVEDLVRQTTERRNLQLQGEFSAHDASIYAPKMAFSGAVMQRSVSLMGVSHSDSWSNLTAVAQHRRSERRLIAQQLQTQKELGGDTPSSGALPTGTACATLGTTHKRGRGMPLPIHVTADSLLPQQKLGADVRKKAPQQTLSHSQQQQQQQQQRRQMERTKPSEPVPVRPGRSSRLLGGGRPNGQLHGDGRLRHCNIDNLLSEEVEHDRSMRLSRSLEGGATSKTRPHNTTMKTAKERKDELEQDERSSLEQSPEWLHSKGGGAEGKNGGGSKSLFRRSGGRRQINFPGGGSGGHTGGWVAIRRTKSSMQTGDDFDSIAKRINPFKRGDEEQLLKLRTHNRRRWSHVFPPGEVEFKQMPGPIWKSLCQPAILPLTTDYLPSREVLEKDYTESFYTCLMMLDQESGARNVGDQDLMEELVCQRIAQDFQLVEGNVVSGGEVKSRSSAPGMRSMRVARGRMVYVLSMGHRIHFLTYDEQAKQVEVKRFLSRFGDNSAPGNSSTYRYSLWSDLVGGFQTVEQNFYRYPNPEYNWNHLDELVCECSAGEDELIETNKYRRLLFLIIPPAPSEGASYVASMRKLEEYLLSRCKGKQGFAFRYPSEAAEAPLAEGSPSADASGPGLDVKTALYGEKQRATVVMAQGKRGREPREWLMVVADRDVNPQRTILLELRWLVCTGSSVSDYVTHLSRRAQQLGLNLCQIPQTFVAPALNVHPFVAHPFLPVGAPALQQRLRQMLCSNLNYVFGGEMKCDWLASGSPGMGGLENPSSSGLARSLAAPYGQGACATSPHTGFSSSASAKKLTATPSCLSPIYFHRSGLASVRAAPRGFVFIVNHHWPNVKPDSGRKIVAGLLSELKAAISVENPIV